VYAKSLSGDCSVQIEIKTEECLAIDLRVGLGCVEAEEGRLFELGRSAAPSLPLASAVALASPALATLQSSLALTVVLLRLCVAYLGFMIDSAPLTPALLAVIHRYFYS